MLFDLGSIRAMEAAASDIASAEDFAVHLKIDSGAGRLGVRPEELDKAMAELARSPHLRLEGVSTLLANAGDPKSPVTDMQLRVFTDALGSLEAQGFRTHYAHLANSAAIALRADSHFNLVRPGLTLYGLPPVPAVSEALDLRPVMTFRTAVVQLKRLPAGAGVSYGHTFVTSRPSVIGILAVGYADGYRRGLQHGGQVLVRGRRAPVVGAVCMDLTMVDLTDVPEASVGDEAVLWGRAGEEVISVNDVARLVQTISYEMLCTVGKRVPRVFHE
jgi:alanine racemase